MLADMSSLRCLPGCTEKPTALPLDLVKLPSFIFATLAAIWAIGDPSPVIAPSCLLAASASWFTCPAIVAFGRVARGRAALGTTEVSHHRRHLKSSE